MCLRFVVPCVLISIGIAQAGDLPSFEGPLESQHFAVNGYVDADSLGGRTLYADGTFAPFSGIYQSGVRLRATGTASWYRFLTNEYPRTFGTGHSLEGALQAGYAIWTPRFNIIFLAGPAFGQGVNEGVTTDRWGGKAFVSIHARPTDETMVSSSIAYSTMANDLQVQAKAGVKIFGGLYVGPETKLTWRQLLPWQTDFSTIAQVSPQTTIATMRLGAHVSALSIGSVLIGASGGWAHDRQVGSGYYGAVNLYQPF
jgi:hypothetical protein